jgi:hypothetical protein
MSRREEGSVAVVVALAMVGLLGSLALVGDLGRVYVLRERAQNAMDAAALAGAEEVFQGAQTAGQEAYAVAQDNGVTADRVVVDTANDTVGTYCTETVPLYFAEVLGFGHATFSVHAQASARSLFSASGVTPIGVVEQNFVYGQEYTLTQGAGDGTGGNYGLLALGGNGASVVEQNLMYGYSGTLSVGQWVSTEPGHETGPVQEGIDYRLQEENSYTFATATESSPRVLILPVIQSLAGNGKSQVLIVGFAAFYLDGLDGSGGHSSVVGRFMQMVVPGSTSTGQNFGLYGVRLTE